ncbi:MAG: glucose-6-phosphate dehydrogenase [Pyrinomonadaceae bacterium]|nr:glucose-6-phosphate dehydrogenase [Phycisphaerales bacterium]
MPAPTSHTAEPCVMVIFGASGDLTHRKLIPSLFEQHRQGNLPPGLAVLGVSRTEMSDNAFRDKMLASAKKFAADFDAGEWSKFAKCLHYSALDATDAAAYPTLSERVNDLARKADIVKPSGSPNILFYLSVSPDLYEKIIGNIGAGGLVSEGRRWCSINPAESSWQRIIVEKPFGSDLESAESLNRALGRVFEEEAIFRIDHYLGKELVQNILVLRFANTIFEPTWNRSHVDHVQVTAAETVGVGSRAANFYDNAGAMRDMIQSHLLQVMAMVAIEQPTRYDGESIMRERMKLFEAAKIVPDAMIPEWGAFGRYAANPAKGEPAYENEEGADPTRRTETYAAMKLELDNWRWAGVPFYLRSGKKLATKLTEIVVQFKKPPTNLFKLVDPKAADRPANRLIINIAPREGISLRIEGKVPGAGLHIDSAKLDLDYIERFGGEPIEAYGPLIMDAIRGDRTLYKNRSEVESGWRICDPFIRHEGLRKSIQSYAAGSWGPESGDELLRRDGRIWHNPIASDVR